MSSCRKPYNFYVFITHDNVKQNSLRIPNEFSREEWKQILTKNIILTVSDNKTWPMSWMISDKNQLWLQNGWPEFAKHYRLKIGHLLLFNHQGNSTFHVRIFGRNSREINYIPLTKVPESETKIDQSVLQEMEVIFKSVPEHKSANPSFSVTLGVTYLKASRLHLPISFCRKYLTAKTKCVDCVLQMPDGGTWGPVNCKDSELCGVLCGKNWKKFSDENHLKVGDVCVFELINEIKKELKVTIIRAR